MASFGRETGPAGMGIRDGSSLADATRVTPRHWPTGRDGVMIGVFPGVPRMPVIKGRFDIRRTPQPPLELGGGAEAMHMRFDKRFEGPLDAASVVHMLAVATAVDGSAAYVALERIEGELDGRAGSFLMRHCGTMDRGSPSLDLEVVPDSGDAELTGLRGAMHIDIVDGDHFYTFEYALG